MPDIIYRGMTHVIRDTVDTSDDVSGWSVQFRLGSEVNQLGKLVKNMTLESAVTKTFLVSLSPTETDALPSGMYRTFVVRTNPGGEQVLTDTSLEVHDVVLGVPDISSGTAGEGVTAGQWGYRTPAGEWFKATAAGNTLQAGSGALGVFLTTASAGQAVTVQQNGLYSTSGLVRGHPYCLSATAGAMVPFRDLIYPNYVSYVGFAKDENTLDLSIAKATGQFAGIVALADVIFDYRGGHGMFQDEAGTTPATTFGQTIKRWNSAVAGQAYLSHSVTAECGTYDDNAKFGFPGLIVGTSKGLKSSAQFSWNEFTILVVAKILTTPSNNIMLSAALSLGDGDFWILQGAGSGNNFVFQRFLTAGGPDVRSVDNTGNIQAFVGMVRSGATSGHIFAGGESSGDTNWTGTPTTGNSKLIVGTPGGTVGGLTGYNGTICHLRGWNKKLSTTDAEIAKKQLADYWNAQMSQEAA